MYVGAPHKKIMKRRGNIKMAVNISKLEYVEQHNFSSQ
jgi:hypothetical protein